MTEHKYTTRDMVTAALNKKPAEFYSALNSVMVDKLRTAVDQKQVEISKELLTPRG